VAGLRGLAGLGGADALGGLAEQRVSVLRGLATARVHGLGTRVLQLVHLLRHRDLLWVLLAGRVQGRRLVRVAVLRLRNQRAFQMLLRPLIV